MEKMIPGVDKSKKKKTKTKKFLVQETHIWYVHPISTSIHFQCIVVVPSYLSSRFVLFFSVYKEKGHS